MKPEFFQKRKQEFAGMELEEHYLGHPIDWEPIYAKYGLDKKGKELDLRGSGLDFRGIDCFFVFKNLKTKKESIFTIDLTAESKKDEWKADKVLHEFPDWRSKKDEYIEKMEQTAKEIAKVLKDRTGPRY